MDLFSCPDTNPPSAANATEEVNSVAKRRSNADLQKRFEPLNDTVGRSKHMFRTTTPPPINRPYFTSEIGGAAPSQEDVLGSARRNRFEEPLNDTTAQPKRVFRKTPPPPRSTPLKAAREKSCGSARSPVHHPSKTLTRGCISVLTLRASIAIEGRDEWFAHPDRTPL